MDSLPNWDLWTNAKSMDDVKSDGLTTDLYHDLSGTLPNPDKPPLFHRSAGAQGGEQLVIDTKLTERLRNNFFLESMIPQYADNLKSLRGFKFDWARNDPN